MTISKKFYKRLPPELWQVLEFITSTNSVKTVFSFETLEAIEKDYKAQQKAIEDFQYGDYVVLEVVTNQKYVLRIDYVTIEIVVTVTKTYEVDVICTQVKT